MTFFIYIDKEKLSIKEQLQKEDLASAKFHKELLASTLV
jgi:hypothetical protein